MRAARGNVVSGMLARELDGIANARLRSILKQNSFISPNASATALIRTTLSHPRGTCTGDS